MFQKLNRKISTVKAIFLILVLSILVTGFIIAKSFELDRIITGSLELMSINN